MFPPPPLLVCIRRALTLLHAAPPRLETACFRDQAPQLALQPLAHGTVRPAADDVGDFVRVALQVVELVELAVPAAVHPVYVLVAVRAHRLVAHADEPGIGVLRP